MFPPLDGSATLLVGHEHDGSERLISYGLRVLARPSGALEEAREYLPAARGAQALELPARLGGGFLFYVLASNTTLFFRAPTFTGDLTPFARLDFEAEQVSAGFDRLYVSTRSSNRLIALDAEQGLALPLGSLPPSPGYGAMAFVDAWFGAVEVPLRGTLVSFDAGGSWRALPVATTNPKVEDGQLRLLGPEGSLGLDATGIVSRRDEPGPANASHASEAAEALRAALTGRGEPRAAHDFAGAAALKLAVLRGFRAADGSLVVADAGRLFRVRASDGSLLESLDHAYPGSGECTALPYAAGFGFACTLGGGAGVPNRSALFAFQSPFAMRLVRTFAGTRSLSSCGNGALVISGSCGDAEAAPRAAHCIADAAGRFRELRRGADSEVERVVALSDGRVAVIVPPRLGRAGSLTSIDARGGEIRVPLKLPEAMPGLRPLLEKGLWLEGFTERRSGGLAGWVVGGGPFAGVRVALDGAVTVSGAESSIDRALLSGQHALIVGRTGRAVQSSDGGFEWSSVDLPFEFDATRELRDDARLQGCSDLGCAFGGFVRVGWNGGHGGRMLRTAPLPAFTSLLQPGGGHWIGRCDATGEVSEEARPAEGRPRAAARTNGSVTAPWAPFLDSRAPPLSAGEVGFDVGENDSDSAPLHAYAWGERGADWTRTGRAELRALDRFDVGHGVFHSAFTRSPWPDAKTAAEAFGLDGTDSPTSWRAVLDPGQRAAAVLTSSRGLLDLLLFEDGKPLTRIANAGRLGLGTLNSVSKLSDAWYVGSIGQNQAFTVSRIRGSAVERVAEYPDTGRDQGAIALVRALRNDELAIWVIARGWYLFPIDAKTLALQKPFYSSPAELSVMPKACASNADGFLLTGAPSLQPSLRLHPHAGEPSADDVLAQRVQGQFLWSASGLCTRALAADAESVIRVRPMGASAQVLGAANGAVPLTVSERRPLGRRWAYLCGP